MVKIKKKRKLKDLAAARRIIQAWNNPNVMTLERYVAWVQTVPNARNNSLPPSVTMDGWYSSFPQS